MIPKKIKKIYLNNVDEIGSNMQNREYINLNDVWHDASEEPQESMNILCLSKKGSINLVSNINEWLYNWLKNESNLDKWAYISDLLPKGGEI